MPSDMQVLPESEVQREVLREPEDPNVTISFHWIPPNRRKKGAKPEVPGQGSSRESPPCIARLMAAAIRMNRLVEDGETNYSDLARLENLTRSRITQIMGLLNLAPDIQEEILGLPTTVRGKDRISERVIRPITGVSDWEAQRKMWGEVSRQGASGCPEPA